MRSYKCSRGGLVDRLNLQQEELIKAPVKHRMTWNQQNNSNDNSMFFSFHLECFQMLHPFTEHYYRPLMGVGHYI